MCADFEEFFRITCDLFPDAANWGFQFPSTSLETTVQWLRQDEEKYLGMESISPVASTTASSSEEESPSPAEVSSPPPQKPFEERTNRENSKKTDESKRCMVCSTKDTTLWRYGGGARGVPKCNACYLYEIHNDGEPRPQRLWGKEIGKRKRSPGKAKKRKKLAR